MERRDYYATRKGISKRMKIDFPKLKKIFLQIYHVFEDELYFQEATGYYCVDYEEQRGLWGSNIEAFIFLKLKMENIWPIQENISNFDEPTLFTIIEFLYDYVSKPMNKWYHEWDRCGWHCTKFDRNEGRDEYRKEINIILEDYRRGYQLSINGEILEIAPTGLEPIYEEVIQTCDPENIDTRIENAILKYRRYGATSYDKKEAIRSLADILEFLKKDGIRFPSKDDSDLFRIINGFDIRHHNKFQQGEYNKDVWYNWMFFTFLSSINALIKLGM